ncbi:transporter substrate-binding domain-containing protein [Niveibacterium umoris]|uniref:Polar amino acid transport system substrate-binding protein n=1 Tax=Niveibacterium umoris TaxID=1193620 RepID=A0A840BPX2_9RHOO|nr:transporter substrate-binding domain-containing protein [Niveibacterium umoris]MBB4014724.1 polar amino acid transport system substrate-binding protein [Niveibacterium umoris]
MRPLAFAVLVATAQLASPAHAEVLDIVAPAFWCPFACQAGDAREGFTIEILRAIFEPAGHKVVLHNENYARALADVRSGQFLATPSTLHDEAPDFVFPEEPVSRNRYCFFTRPNDAWLYSGAGTLKGRTVGVVQGYSYGEAIDHAMEKHAARFEVVAGDDLTLRLARMMQAERIDAFVEEENLVAWLRFKEVVPPLRAAGCEAPLYGYVAFSPTNPRSKTYAAQFSRGIRQLRADGRLARILARYGLRDWR